MLSIQFNLDLWRFQWFTDLKFQFFNTVTSHDDNAAEEVEAVGGKDDVDSEDESENSVDNNDNAKGDTQDNPAADEEMLVELSLDKECAAGDQEEARIPLLESVS